MADVVSRLVITALDQTAAAFKSAEKRAEGLADGFVSASKKIATVGAAGVVALTAMAVKGAQASEELLRLSQSFNIPPERLLNLQTAAELTSTSIETVSKAALRLGGVVGETLAGKTTAAADALRSLGISQEELKPIQNDTEAQLRLVAQRFSELPPGIQRTTAAAEIFGNKLATQMVPFLLEGNEAMQQAQQDLQKLGIEVSNLDVSRAENLGDQFDRAKGILRAVSIEIASFAGPRVQTLLDLFLDSADAANDMGGEGLTAGQKIDAALAASLDTAQTLIKLFMATKARLTELALGASEFNVELGEAAQSAVRLATFGAKTDAFAENLAEARQQSNELRESLKKADAQAERAFSAGSAGSAYLDRLEKNLADGAAALEKFNGASGRALELSGDSGKADKELERFRDRIKTIVDSTRTESEVLEESFSEQLELLEQAEKRKEISQQQFNTVKLKLEEKFQADLTKLKERENKVDDQVKQQAQTRLEAILAAQATEVEQRELKLTEDLEVLQQNHELKLISEEDFQARRREIIARAEADIQAIKDEARLKEEEKELQAREKKLQQLQEITGIQQQTLDDLFNFQNLGFGQQLGALASFGASFTGALAGQSKKAFEIHKKFAIAEAIISTLKGIDIALGSAPPPLNFALAAAVAAKGFATVAQIKSTQPGGGSGGGGAGGGAGGGLGAGSISGASALGEDGGGPGEAGRARTLIEITVAGAVFDRRSIETIIEGINDAVGDNVKLVVA